MKIFSKKQRIIPFKPAGFGNCTHPVLGYIEPWIKGLDPQEKIGDAAVCVNCGNGVLIVGGIKPFIYPELTKTPGAFHHTPRADRRKVLGLTA